MKKINVVDTKVRDSLSIALAREENWKGIFGIFLKYFYCLLISNVILKFKNTNLFAFFN